MYILFDFETTGLEFTRDFPIEIGMFWLDDGLRLKEVYHSYIKWPQIKDTEKKEDGGWRGRWAKAYEVHNIPLDKILKEGKPADIVAEEILSLVEKYSQEGEKLILVSDNAVFDFAFLAKVFAGSKFTTGDTIAEGMDYLRRKFHYAVWDLNLLLETVGLYAPSAHHSLLDISSNWSTWYNATKLIKGTRG